MDNETYNAILEEAREYNKWLINRSLVPLTLTDEDRVRYLQTLDVTGTGLMGYISIPAANIYLPIYHGTSDAVLQQGVGHLDGSSLPVGGESTHTILSGHRGLPSAKLFTNLDRLKIGDTFTIHVLNEIITYEVDQITTIEPYILNQLEVVEGEDFCTLLTCTPYGVNTHRLLIRGHRIPTPPGQQQDPQTNQIFLSFGENFDPIMLIPVGVAVAVLVVIIVLAIHYYRRHRKLNRRPRHQTHHRL